jgi:glycosyltransferase A (GT-A) superfamily protein (DUF2064 family)/8-oxo-dGTP pyrophosphatase MutT (NUDIX family)
MHDIQGRLKENAMIIFAKWPEPGTCKTRIATETSPRFALEFSMACLTDLILNVGDSDYYDLLIGVNTPEELVLFEEHYGLSGILTHGTTQSDKFHSIFSRLLEEEGYRKALLIPMDLPFLSQEDMIAAFAWLDTYLFAHGPESNGGIYLIGIRAPYTENIFRDVRWSTPTSFEDLTRNCGQENVYSLRKRDDLNSFKAVLNARRGIAHHCPTLFKLLVKEGYYLPDDRYVDFDVLPISIPVATAIVQRRGPDGHEVLVQIRWKPSTDPTYTGTLELPSGLVRKHEPAYQAVVREVREETGLEVQVLSSHVESETPLEIHHEKIHNDVTAAYMPFCCTQQIQGGRAYIGMAFLCRVVGGKLQANRDESINPRWIKLTELGEMLQERPEEIFPIDLPVLRRYVEYARNHMELADADVKGASPNGQ